MNELNETQLKMQRFLTGQRAFLLALKLELEKPTPNLNDIQRYWYESWEMNELMGKGLHVKLDTAESMLKTVHEIAELEMLMMASLTSLENVHP